MPLDQRIYYIIDTPVVDTSFIELYTSYGGTPNINTINKNNRSTIYYSDIVTATVFDVNTRPANVSGIPTTYFPLIAYATPDNPYRISDALNIYDLSKELSNRLINFINDIQLVNRCNSFISPNTNAIPDDCQDTFDGYSSNNGIDNTKLPLYVRTVMNTTNRKKHLPQQSYDLNNLIIKYDTIIGSIQQNTENYDQIKRMHDNNVALRNELDQKLGEIYKYKDSKIMQSQYNLDKTVYTNVLLTVLATSMIYVVFSRL